MNDPVNKRSWWPAIVLGLLLGTACEPSEQRLTRAEPTPPALEGRWRSDSSRTWLFSPTHQLLASTSELGSRMYTNFDTTVSTGPTGVRRLYTRHGDTLLLHQNWPLAGAATEDMVKREFIQELSATRLTLRQEVHDPTMHWVFEYYYARAPAGK
jgi:hypothetical protein